MNFIVLAVTVWLILVWIGLVLLIAKTGRNRRANPQLPSLIATTRGNRRTSSRRSHRPQAGAPYYWAGTGGGGATDDWSRDEKLEEWGGGDFGGGGNWGGGDSGGGDSGGGDSGGGDSGGGDSGGGDSGGGGD